MKWTKLTLTKSVRYLPVLKPYAVAFADTLTPSQRNHLRVLLSSPTKMELLRKALGLPARRRMARPVVVERRGARGAVLDVTDISGGNQNG
jgi:hypothetical protein